MVAEHIKEKYKDLDLMTKHCCGTEMHHIYNTDEQLTKGWWCQHCHHWIEPASNELGLEPDKLIHWYEGSGKTLYEPLR